MTRSLTISVALSLVLGALMPAERAAAEWARDGVLVAETSEIESWKLVPDGAGGAVLAWVDYRCLGPGTSCFGVFGRRIASDGSFSAGWDPLGSTFVYPTGDWRAHLSEMAADGAGGAWFLYHQTNPVGHGSMRVAAGRFQDGGTGWSGALLDSNTTRSGYTGLLQSVHGCAIVAWSEDRGARFQNHLFAQCYASGGVPLWSEGGHKLSKDPLLFWSFGITGDGAGGAVLAWTEDAATADSMRLQRIDADGNAKWRDGGIALRLVDRAYPPLALAPDGTGGAFLAWYDTRSDAGDIYLVRIGGDGAVPAGWSADGRLVCGAADKQSMPALVPDGAGGVFVTWRDARGFVLVQRMTASGAVAPGWTEGGVMVGVSASSDEAPAIVSDGAGGVYLAWSDVRNGIANRDIYAQHVMGTGAVAAGWSATGNPVCEDPSPQWQASLVPDGGGGAIVAWLDGRTATPGMAANFYAQALSVDGVTPARTLFVRLAWAGGAVRVTARSSVPGTVELWRSDLSGAVRIGAAEPDANGGLSFEDRDVEPGRRYEYWLRLADGSRSAAEPIEIPEQALVLEGLSPNPAWREMSVALSLPRRGDVTIELLDLSGRKVLERRFDALTPGRHTLALAPRGAVTPGLYLIRVAQGDRMAVKKGVVVR